MKKEVLILPLLLLTACAGMNGDAYDLEESYEGETYNNGMYAEDTGLNVPNQVGQNTQPMPQPAVPTPQMPNQNRQPPLQQAKISPDGTMIELPAQQIFLGEADGNSGQMTVTLPPVAYSEPAGVQPSPLPQPQLPRQAKVTLQNIAYPNTFAQCAAEDMGCIASYEQQGYRRLNGAPQFAGYYDQPTHSDYPGNGRWRNGNNIPRW